MDNYLIFLIISIVLLFGFIFLFFKFKQKHDYLYKKYKGIIDIDAEIDLKTKEFEEMKSDYKVKKEIYDKFLLDLSIIQEEYEFTTYGVYHPHFDFDTSEKYKEELDMILKEQKSLIKEKDAIICNTEWTVEGSKVKGRQMTNRSMKLMLRAFNGECDATVLKVKWNNIIKMEERIKKAFETINKLGEPNRIYITDSYLDLKIKELHLAHEYQEKKYEEKEEQRKIREQMREEEKVQKEIEQAKKEAEDDERKYQKALAEVKAKMTMAKDEEMESLNKKLIEMQQALEDAQEKKERAISRAQLTKSGHVYIISNIGSFGERVYKIGLTRRLEPLIRVKELGDASVPFAFDVHAMIYSENAPELEAILHQEFKATRLNQVNFRKEFFQVELEDIEKKVRSEHEEIEFTKVAEAKEYRETLAIMNELKNIKTEPKEEKFPDSL
jgi:hypothetical protein